MVQIDDAINDLLDGEWVEAEKVQNALGLSFTECFRRFDFSRTAEWWSVVGTTDEERGRNGQNVMCYFRVKPTDKKKEPISKHIKDSTELSGGIYGN